MSGVRCTRLYICVYFGSRLTRQVRPRGRCAKTDAKYILQLTLNIRIILFGVLVRGIPNHCHRSGRQESAKFFGKMRVNRQSHQTRFVLLCGDKEEATTAVPRHLASGCARLWVIRAECIEIYVTEWYVRSISHLLIVCDSVCVSYLLRNKSFWRCARASEVGLPRNCFNNKRSVEWELLWTEDERNFKKVKSIEEIFGS